VSQLLLERGCAEHLRPSDSGARVVVTIPHGRDPIDGLRAVAGAAGATVAATTNDSLAVSHDCLQRSIAALAALAVDPKVVWMIIDPVMICALKRLATGASALSEIRQKVPRSSPSTGS
jgi:hypothetical protein